MSSVSNRSGQVSREVAEVFSGGPRTEEERLRASTLLMRALTEIQAAFIRGGDPRALFDRLLTALLALTGSEEGFIGEVYRASGEASSFRVLVTYSGAWAHELRELAVREAPLGGKPRTLRELVGAAFTHGGPVVSGGTGLEARGEGLPADPLLPRCFLGLPLEVGGERVGLVGVANRPGGYDEEVIDLLQPFLTVCGSMLLGWHTEQRRRQAEQELRHTQAEVAERLRLVMDSVEDGVWDMELSTGSLFVNRRWLGMLGYEEGELEPTYETWSGLCHPDDVPEVERRVHSLVKGSLPLMEYEQRLRRKDGGWTWVLTRCKVVARDEQGRALRMVGSNVDISARKRSEERWRALVEAIPDLIFRMSVDGTYLDYQAGRGEHLVVRPEDVIGTNIRQLPVPQSFVENGLMHLRRAIVDGVPQVYEYELDMPQGRESFEWRVVRSGPDEAVCIVRNITERKRVEERLRQQEEELRRHRDQLEELVRSRTEKLVQATHALEAQQVQLIQAEKMASLGHMAAGVAHEINNPVSYVMSNLGTLGQYVSVLTPLLAHQRELLEVRGEVPSDLRARLGDLWAREDVDFILGDMPEMIEESLEGTRRIKEIVQSLRTFAREDSGEPQLVNVNEELETTLKMVWNELKYKCEVVRDFGKLPPVSCHPTQLTQVFTNLLLNASQAIETKGEIRIHTRQEEGEVVVRISDTGHGMSQETLARLFTPFFTTKPRGQGTGLGLSISYGIITRHKGRIEVRSEPGQGSTFIIRLPATLD